MALRLEKNFRTSAESWLGMQQQYGLWKARKLARLGKVRRLSAEQ
jgi:plasmid maintenance system antidote protein VapI